MAWLAASMRGSSSWCVRSVRMPQAFHTWLPHLLPLPHLLAPQVAKLDMLLRLSQSNLHATHCQLCLR